MHCNGHSPYTGEATAIGALYSEAAAKIAVLAKTTRKAMIGFLVLGYASNGQAVGDRAAFLRQKFPKFVLRFLLISILATGRLQQKGQLGSLASCRTGLRAFAVGAIGELLIAPVNLVMMLVAAKAFNL